MLRGPSAVAELIGTRLSYGHNLILVTMIVARPHFWLLDGIVLAKIECALQS